MINEDILTIEIIDHWTK